MTRIDSNLKNSQRGLIASASKISMTPAINSLQNLIDKSTISVEDYLKGASSKLEKYQENKVE